MKLLRILIVMVLTAFYIHTPAQTSKGKAPAKKHVAAKYQCPMKCEGDKTYVKAGTCAECGMTLKAVRTK